VFLYLLTIVLSSFCTFLNVCLLCITLTVVLCNKRITYLLILFQFVSVVTRLYTPLDATCQAVIHNSSCSSTSKRTTASDSCTHKVRSSHTSYYCYLYSCFLFAICLLHRCNKRWDTILKKTWKCIKKNRNLGQSQTWGRPARCTFGWGDNLGKKG